MLGSTYCLVDVFSVLRCVTYMYFPFHVYIMIMCIASLVDRATECWRNNCSSIYNIWFQLMRNCIFLYPLFCALMLLQEFLILYKGIHTHRPMNHIEYSSLFQLNVQIFPHIFVLFHFLGFPVLWAWCIYASFLTQRNGNAFK